jgi:hypothetical protein
MSATAPRKKTHRKFDFGAQRKARLARAAERADEAAGVTPPAEPEAAPEPAPDPPQAAADEGYLPIAGLDRWFGVKPDELFEIE